MKRPKRVLKLITRPPKKKPRKTRLKLPPIKIRRKLKRKRPRPSKRKKWLKQSRKLLRLNQMLPKRKLQMQLQRQQSHPVPPLSTQ